MNRHQALHMVVDTGAAEVWTLCRQGSLYGFLADWRMLTYLAGSLYATPLHRCLLHSAMKASLKLSVGPMT